MRLIFSGRGWASRTTVFNWNIMCASPSHSSLTNKIDAKARCTPYIVRKDSEAHFVTTHVPSRSNKCSISIRWQKPVCWRRASANPTFFYLSSRRDSKQMHRGKSGLRTCLFWFMAHLICVSILEELSPVSVSSEYRSHHLTSNFVVVNKPTTVCFTNDL